MSEPEVDLLCMLALTIGTTADTVTYDSKEARFTTNQSVKCKGGGTRAALLALRMLWFWKPNEFPQTKSIGGDAERNELQEMYSTPRVRTSTG